MKKIKILMIFFVLVISTIVGILPFYFAYPFCSSCTNSGPANFWELILMLSYEGQKWYLLVGIVLLLVSVFSYFKQQKVWVNK